MLELQYSQTWSDSSKQEKTLKQYCKTKDNQV